MVNAKNNGRAVRKPVQARAKATVDGLCAAAVRVIEQGGLPAFNTNAVAAEAGVSIQTLYAYFPDKYDILREIFRREQSAYAQVLVPCLEKVATQQDWRAVVRKCMRTAASALVVDPGFIAVRNAMISVPGMASLTAEADDELAEVMAQAFRVRRPELTRRAASNAAQVLITTMGAGLERATAGGSIDRPLLSELTAVTIASMERVLEEQPVAVG